MVPNPIGLFNIKLDCVGNIDGTHVTASVPKDMELSFCGRKSYATQNVMATLILIFDSPMYWLVGRGQHMMI
jgi:hypothetical protein